MSESKYKIQINLSWHLIITVMMFTLNFLLITLKTIDLLLPLNFYKKAERKNKGTLDI